MSGRFWVGEFLGVDVWQLWWVQRERVHPFQTPNSRMFLSYASSTRTPPICRLFDEKFIPTSVTRLPEARYFSA